MNILHSFHAFSSIKFSHRKNDEPTPVVEAVEPCDNSAVQEFVVSECPENDVETKSNTVPVPSVSCFKFTYNLF